MNPLDSDTDGDGLPDSWEIEHNINPLPFITTPSLDWGTAINPQLSIFDDLSTGSCFPSVDGYRFHQDCLILTDPNGEDVENRWKLNDYFPGQNRGSVEFYFSGSDTIKHNAFYIMDEGSVNCITLSMDNDTLNYYNGSEHIFLMDIYPDIWYHVLIEFDCTTDWHIWVNGVSIDVGEGYPFRGHPTFMNEVLLLGGLNSNGYSVRYDKIGYSWETTIVDDPGADPDEDGDNNLEEFLRDTDPQISDRWKQSNKVLWILGLTCLGVGSIMRVQEKRSKNKIRSSEISPNIVGGNSYVKNRESYLPSLEIAPQFIFCTDCGSRNPHSAGYCHECGRYLEKFEN